MRVLSLNLREALFAQESGEVVIFLLVITHPTLADPIRLSTDRPMPISIDGEVLAETPVTARIARSAIRVAAPRPTPAG